MPSESNPNTTNAVDLLREEVTLLREMKTTLAALQDSQIKMQQSLSTLASINAKSTKDGMDVYIQNMNMPFFSMMGFMIKWMIASIPAGIIVMVLFAFVFIAISLLCGGLTGVLAVLSNLGR